MTALGKVMTFFVLLFSMVTCGLIVKVYVTRTNWHNAFREADKQTQVAVAALKAEQDRARAQKDNYEAKIKELETLVGAKDRDLLGKNAEIKDLRDRQAELNTKARTEQANNEAATIEINKLKSERDQMVGTITARNQHINKLETDIVGFRDRAVQAEINANAQTSRNERLMVQIEQMRAQLEDFKRRGLEPRDARAAAGPSVEVKGEVKEVSGQFATISLGRNHEIKDGDTLQVYRLAPSPQYLGTLTVTRADITESVGRFAPINRQAKIQKGDTVDTKIVGGR